MDNELQEAKRKAVADGDYTDYDALLNRVGKSRMIMKRLWVRVFERGYVWSKMALTNWSPEDEQYYYAAGIYFDLEGATIEPGLCFFAKWEDELRGRPAGSSLTPKVRILGVETKELTIFSHWLEDPPDEDTARNTLKIQEIKKGQ